MTNKETFNVVLKKFKINNKRSYDFLLRASEEFKEAVLKLCERIINDETIPENFRDTTLYQIWKRKPGTKKEDLSANRHIHIKEWLPRTVESMVVQEKVNIVEDYRAQRVGGFLTALQLWESCVIPSLLYNSPCWVGMGREEEKALSECQDFFLRLALATGPGASKVALRANFGVRSMASGSGRRGSFSSSTSGAWRTRR